MSADSDSDEFFDALDSFSSSAVTSTSQSFVAERNLREILPTENAYEDTSKQLAIKRAAENEERRRKLEVMREQIANRSTSEFGRPISWAANKSPSATITGPVSSLTTETAGLPKRSGSTPNIGVLTAEQVHPVPHSGEAEDIMLSHRDSMVGSPMSSSTTTVPTMAGDEPQSENMTILVGIDKLPHRTVPELLVDMDGDDELQNVNSASEPDIVQSTKSSSLNRQGALPSPRPVAPPRKKKQAPQPPLSAKCEPDLCEQHLPQSAGLPVDDALSSDHCTVAGAILLPGSSHGTEPTLDIQSATQGNRLVTAAEDLSAKAAQNSPPITTKDDEALDKVAEGAATVQDCNQSLVSLTLGMRNDGEEYSIPLSMKRPRSNSGTRYLTDQEILDQVYVLNLDTGETLPLSSAEEKLPKCINPLSLHIMRRTKEYYSDSSLPRGGDQSDEDTLKDTSTASRTVKVVKPIGKRKRKLKKFLGKTVHKIKSVADEVFHGEEILSDEEDSSDGRRVIKVKASHSHKGPYDFDLLVPVQELASQKMSAIWTMKFSQCGRLLATGGQDNLLHIWVLKDAFAYFDDMRRKYSEAGKTTPYSDDGSDTASVKTDSDAVSLSPSEASVGSSCDEDEHMPFMKQPFCVYRGHSADLLDVSWSKNYFILSSSMDKTVRLWHVSRRECLCCFQHIDFVTAIAFHPKDDRYFLSGSLDGKIRLWNIPDKKVALWNEVTGATKLITAANFCLNGRFAVIGTYDGRCIFYNTEQLKYHTQIHVRSTRGRNARGRKITGVEPFPGEDKMLVTSNDSRIRLYDLRDLTLTCKYKGCTNNSSQIKASFSHDGHYIICGSEDQSVYIWKTQHEFYKFSSARRDRNDYWEGVKAHSAVVTNAIFAPHPEVIIRPQFQYVDDEDPEASSGVRGEVLVSADYAGVIKVFINKFKPGSGV